MSGRFIIVIEYEADLEDLQQAIREAMTQVQKAVRHDQTHVHAVQAHLAIQSHADRVLAVFADDEVTS
jgi:hypothetical protein